MFPNATVQGVPQKVDNQLVKKFFLSWTEPSASSCIQNLITGLYPEPDESTLPHSISLRFVSILPSHL